MRIGSLFSGIGGLELGLEWAGVGRTVWQVERDPFCRAVLARHWPDAERFEDVCTVGVANLAPVDVICGGFPCQDISYAGKGAGLDGERSGLWFEFARIVREMGPRYVVVENVSALLTRGLDAVLGTLASLGYDAEWCCVRASDVGARHRRDRVFLIGYLADADSVTFQRPGAVGEMAGASGPGEGRQEEWQRDGHTVTHCRASLAHGYSHGRKGERCGQLLNGERAAHRDNADRCRERDLGDANVGERHGGQSDRSAVAQPRVGRAAHGISTILDGGVTGDDQASRSVARLDVAWPGQPQHAWEATRIASTAPHRSKRLRALGNTVVPQVAQVVGRRLMGIARNPAI